MTIFFIWFNKNKSKHLKWNELKINAPRFELDVFVCQSVDFWFDYIQDLLESKVHAFVHDI